MFLLPLLNLPGQPNRSPSNPQWPLPSPKHPPAEPIRAPLIAIDVGAHRNRRSQPPGHRWVVNIPEEGPRTEVQESSEAMEEEQAVEEGRLGGFWEGEAYGEEAAKYAWEAQE